MSINCIDSWYTSFFSLSPIGGASADLTDGFYISESVMDCKIDHFGFILISEPFVEIMSLSEDVNCK